MPTPLSNPKGRKKPLSYKIDPDLYEFVSSNGKTALVERLLREEAERIGWEPEDERA